MPPTINHIGLYVTDLERAKQFFEKYFGATANERYTNEKKGFFASYFLTFAGGTRLEIMTKQGIDGNKAFGSCHIAFSVGSKEAVNLLSEQLKADGFELLDGPRTTGDGYYESLMVGIDGNLIEVTE